MIWTLMAKIKSVQTCLSTELIIKIYTNTMSNHNNVNYAFKPIIRLITSDFL